jgi:hypothetical protein
MARDKPEPERTGEKKMRQVFFTEEDYETLQAVEDEAPWAEEIVEAEGGWWAFESALDADVWRDQQ